MLKSTGEALPVSKWGGKNCLEWLWRLVQVSYGAPDFYFPVFPVRWLWRWLKRCSWISVSLLATEEGVRCYVPRSWESLVPLQLGWGHVTWSWAVECKCKWCTPPPGPTIKHPAQLFQSSSKEKIRWLGFSGCRTLFKDALILMPHFLPLDPPPKGSTTSQ